MINSLPQHVIDKFYEDCQEYYQTDLHQVPNMVVNMYNEGTTMATVAVGKWERRRFARWMMDMNRKIPHQYSMHFEFSPYYQTLLAHKKDRTVSSRMRFYPVSSNTLRGSRRVDAIFALEIADTQKWKDAMQNIEFLRSQNIPVYEQYLTAKN